MNTTRTPDGLLRMPRAALDQLSLSHLLSGMDDEVDGPGKRCGAATTLSGYTEWISPQSAALTLGWDWQLTPGIGMPRVTRLGLPRTNIQVLDSCHIPLSWEDNLQVLASFIDSLDWTSPALEAVCDRYVS